MEELVFHLTRYDGPLDLLLALIAKNKMDILDIQISVIFGQYMEYVDDLKKMDSDAAGDFIVMASELMLIKSRMLLPHEPEDDPRSALVQTLMDYQTVKELSGWFSEREKTFAGRFCKDEDELEPGVPDDNSFCADELKKMLRSMLMRMADDETQKYDKPIEAIDPIIKRKIVSIPAKIIWVMRLMYKKSAVHLDELFENAEGRSEIIAVFYSVLELLKAGRVTLCRDPEFDGSVDDGNIVLKFNYNKIARSIENDGE